MDEKNRIWWFFTIGIFAVLLLPAITTKGMFFDGLTNASIARNMAVGRGSFWVPVYASPLFQHPTLASWCESLFFRIMGDHFFVEKIYSFCTGILAALLIVRMWRYLMRAKPHPLSWLPLLLWILTPIVYWSCKNNMLENTLTLFCLGAVFSCIAAYRTEKYMLWLFVSSACVFLGILSKGPVALFPLATPFLYWLVYRSVPGKKMVLHTMYHTGLVVIGMGLLLLYTPAYNFFAKYMEQQVIIGITGKGRVASVSMLSKLFVLKGLFLDNLLTMLCLSGLILFIGHKKHIRISPDYQKAAVFFILIGVSASFPLMIAAVKNGFYIVPSIPFYAIGLAILIFPIVETWYTHSDIKHRGWRIFKGFSIALIIIGIAIPCVRMGTIGRDRDILDDLYVLKPYIPQKTSLAVSDSMVQDWRLYAYMIRYFYLSFYPQDKESVYFFLRKGDVPKNPYATRIPVTTKNFDLFIDQRKKAVIS